MISPLLLALLCCVFTAAYAGQICGNCQHELDPRYCDTVTECGDHEVKVYFDDRHVIYKNSRYPEVRSIAETVGEKIPLIDNTARNHRDRIINDYHQYCSVQRYVLGSTVRYDMGCKEADVCNLQASAVGRRSYTDGRFIVCEECCNNTALCSTFEGLCGSLGLDKSSGPVCYQCDAMRSPGECDRVTQCSVNQQCYVGQKVASLTGDVLWESRCGNASECLSTSGTILPPVIGRRDIRAPVNGLCSVCCSNGHLCNRECHHSSAVSVTKIQTPTTTLIPHVAPHITILRGPPVVYVGTNVTLTCIAEGNPSPKLKWYTKNAANASSNIHIEAGNSLLIIENFRSENYGSYACLAYNNLREHDFRYTVLTPPTTTSTQQTTTTTLLPTTIKQGAPHITIIRGPSVVYVGTNVTLTCIAEGNPSPKLEWYTKNGTNITSNIHIEAGNSLLMIENFRSENYGTYACRAYNSLGNDFRYTVLTPPTTSTTTRPTTTTLLPTTKKHISPHITFLSHPGTVHIGTNVTLTCLAAGYPVPTLQWAFLASHGVLPTNVRQMGGNIVITNFRSENFGHYACMARNSLGNDRREVEISSK